MAKKRREPPYFECLICSALIWDVLKHTAWHEDE